MKKTERLNGIVYALKERGKMTAHELAQLFEVSVRTIYRDIDALSQLKVPIYTYDGVNGGYEINMDYFIPSISLTEQEITMLLIVLGYGETIRLPNLTADYQILKGKIINALTDVDQIKVQKLMKRIMFGGHRVEPTSYNSDILWPILDSFIEECNLDITYYNPRRDDYGKRTISPTKLSFEEGGWYLQAFCHLRQEKRVFRLDRINDIHLNTEPNAYLDTAITSSTEKFVGTEYLINIEKSLFRVLRENDYFSDILKIYDTASPNNLQVRFFTKYEEEIINITMRNPESITVLEPGHFIDKIKSIAKKLNEKYL